LKSSSAVKEDVGKVRAEMKKLYVSLFERGSGMWECGVGPDPRILQALWLVAGLLDPILLCNPTFNQRVS